MSEVVRSEYTGQMPEGYASQSAVDVAAMTEEQQADYAESFEPDRMGFSGKEGI